MPSGLSWVTLVWDQEVTLSLMRQQLAIRSGQILLPIKRSAGIPVHPLFSLDNKWVSRSNLRATKQRTAHPLDGTQTRKET